MLEKFYIACNAENHWELTDRARADDKIIYLKDEYEKFWQKVLRGENFALPRYGDGERALMIGRAVKAQEGWNDSGGGVTPLGEALNDSLKITSPNFYYGVSCPCCDSAAYYWYLQNIKNYNITFANIWLNSNFKAFQKNFAELERDTVLITNWRGKGKKYGKLNIKKHYAVSDDCIKFWKEDGKNLIRQIIADFGHEKNLLYVISAGPLSCVIIAALFKNNPDNCYIDFGSATDLMTHEKITRPYMVDGTAYAKQSCWMFDRKKIDLDIDVVLTCYKRPQVLEQQITAIKNQTLKPRRIFLYQDGIDGYYKVELNKKVLNAFDSYKISPTNGGVWKRFEFANKVAKSPYVCIFDDDTIPGERWFENCHMNMMQNRGVYVTNACLINDIPNYPKGSFWGGWHTGNEKTCAVDFGGHAWFFEREYLNWMLEKPYRKKYKIVAEDMTISFAASEHGYGTYAPQHPKNILSLWGSIPEFGWKYGLSEVAISVNSNNLQLMIAALNELHDDGWKLLLEENPDYLKEFVSVCKPPTQDDKLHERLFKLSSRLLLPLFGKKAPIFLGEKTYLEPVCKLFELPADDYKILEDENKNINATRLYSFARRYAVHVFFTDVYGELKPFLEQNGWQECVDFVDGRGLLYAVSD